MLRGCIAFSIEASEHSTGQTFSLLCLHRCVHGGGVGRRRRSSPGRLRRLRHGSL